MEKNKIPYKLHTCIMEERVKELEAKNYRYEILKVILTPKIILSVCLGLSFILQVLKGV